MLINASGSRKHIKYECSRCKNEMTTDNRFGIYTVEQRGEMPKKRWDLCTKCFRALVKGIEKGVNR